ncbi:MAG: (2Fe-2S)-binding protein [Gemmatimonadaceae bacterium]|jgi:isoquinoline 1-oxidoreductase alpha subunit|nr:(2Fe-2S)-binding protein [Gemmatimonadaceae bacterium]
MAKYTLNVNGAPKTVEVEADTPLLWVLRDSLDLTGAKFGCGIAQCGACTVHLNGVATRSCRTPISTVGAARVTTIEGIDTPQARALQDAWCELDVPQCGYCQGGQILAAAALLKSKPNPTDADIDAAMARNLCRCASYTRIRAGIKRAAELAATATPANGKRE